MTISVPAARRPRGPAIWFVLVVGVAGPLLSQQPAWEGGRTAVSRPELGDVLRQLELAAASPAYSPELRAEAVRRVEEVRQRLREGDFRVGNRILLQVDGSTVLNDTFAVGAGRTLILPGIGPVPLAGVLRSELDSMLTVEISRFVRNALVRARPLLPLSVVGEVTRPGYYHVPLGVPVSQAVMLAGGPTSAARLTGVRIERGKVVVLDDKSLHEAIAQGRTLEELDLRAGDRVVVPREVRGDIERTVRVMSLAVTVPAALFGLFQLLSP